MQRRIQQALSLAFQKLEKNVNNQQPEASSFLPLAHCRRAKSLSSVYIVPRHMMKPRLDGSSSHTHTHT